MNDLQPPGMDPIRTLFEQQHPTALGLRGSSAGERVAKLRRLRTALLDHRQALYAAGEADFRKPPAEVDLGELMPAVSEANQAIRSLARWMRPKRVSPTFAMLGTRAWVRPEPRGRTLIISPWNYPANLSFGPLISAVAAGNTAILKPSELTPAFSAVIRKIIESVFPVTEVAVVEGDAEVSRALLELPFDHIFFTGSTAVGKLVMAAAAKHLSSVTLELGGKSPTIVDASADLDRTAASLCWGKFTNNGQTCIAPDHIYVHESVAEGLIEACRKVLERSYGSTLEAQLQSPHLARVVNERHTQRLAGLLSDALQRGAQAASGGQVRLEERFLAPTLLTGVPEDAQVLQEEIFGPLLPILPYRDIDSVLNHFALQPKPLALYVYSRDQAFIDRVLSRTSAGGTCINTCVLQFGHGKLPFGGVNHSGIGHSHGEFGFQAFSHQRSVLRDHFGSAWLLYPPYTGFTRRLIGGLMKWG